MIKYLVTKDYVRKELEDWSMNEIIDTYKVELFDEQADKDAGIEDYTDAEKRVALSKDGYQPAIIANMNENRVNHLFAELLKEEAAAKAEEATDYPTAKEAKDYLADREYGNAMLEYMTDHRAFELYFIEKEEEAAETEEENNEIDQATVSEIRAEIISMLVDDKVISAEKLVMMSDENLVKFCEEVYGDGILDQIIVETK